MAVPPVFFDTEPDFMLGEESLGPQRSSMRPSSARYSFGRGGRSGNSSVRGETPGPAAYRVAEAAASGVPTAFFGTGVQNEVAKPYQYPDVVEGEVTTDFVQPAAPCAVFGTEERGTHVVDPELVRNCPECRLGQAGPGFVYTPNDRSASRGRRPQSAPSYTIPKRGTALHQKEQQARSPAEVGPNSYRSEGAIGVQRDSRRKTCRSSSFSRSDRFPQPREAQGNASAECAPRPSSLGSSEAGKHKQRRAPSAGFGTSTRECASRARLCRGAADRPPSARLGRPNLPHPRLAPQREVIRNAPVV